MKGESGEGRKRDGGGGREAERERRGEREGGLSRLNHASTVKDSAYRK